MTYVFPDSAVINSPATPEALRLVERKLNVNLPSDLSDFLLSADGMSAPESILLYSTQDLEERNRTFEVNAYAKGYIAIGDDGGGHLFLMDLSGGDTGVFMADQGTLQPSRFLRIAESLQDWILSGCPTPSPETDEPFGELVDVYLERMPPGGTRDLVVVKRELGISTGIVELAQLAKRAPIRILKGVPAGKYTVRCQKANQLVPCLDVRNHQR